MRININRWDCYASTTVGLTVSLFERDDSQQLVLWVLLFLEVKKNDETTQAAASNVWDKHAFHSGTAGLPACQWSHQERPPGGCVQAPQLLMGSNDYAMPRLLNCVVTD